MGDIKISDSDRERIQTVVDGCKKHPSYRALLMPTADCPRCVEVLAAKAMLCASGIVDAVKSFRAHLPERKQKEAA